jgi:hypothetical protein
LKVGLQNFKEPVKNQMSYENLAQILLSFLSFSFINSLYGLPILLRGSKPAEPTSIPRLFAGPPAHKISHQQYLPASLSE